MFRPWQLLTALAMLVGLTWSDDARADYCSDVDWGHTRFPDGDCPQITSGTIRWTGGTTELKLMAETELSRSMSASRRREWQAAITEVTGAVGGALRRVGGVSLQQNVHVVIVDDRSPDGGRAETIRRADGVSDCAIMLYDSAVGPVGVYSRSLAHELFHCTQYATWPGKIGSNATRWWSEGSAEWFEDFALPTRAADSDIARNAGLFRARITDHSLMENMYANVVFFTWLGPDRVAPYISRLAKDGEDQMVGARAALTADDYQNFAQDYVDGRISTPSGLRLDGVQYVPDFAVVHTTTGNTASDPAYAPATPVRPFTIRLGKVVFSPGEYAPTGRLGERRKFFSEGSGPWSELPNPLAAACGASRTFRFAAMTTSEASLTVNPNTRVSGNRNCTCPVGNWTISTENIQERFAPRPDDKLLDRGEVRLVFDAGGIARFRAMNMRFESPVINVRSAQSQVTTTISMQAAWTWTAKGNQITMVETEPVTITEQVSGWTQLPVIGRTTENKPPKTRGGTVSTWSGRPKVFECKDGRLGMTKPIANAGKFTWVDDEFDLNYPHSGIFVREQ